MLTTSVTTSWCRRQVYEERNSWHMMHKPTCVPQDTKCNICHQLSYCMFHLSILQELAFQHLGTENLHHIVYMWPDFPHQHKCHLHRECTMTIHCLDRRHPLGTLGICYSQHLNMFQQDILLFCWPNNWNFQVEMFRKPNCYSINDFNVDIDRHAVPICAGAG